jgi:hypothetical protein
MRPCEAILGHSRSIVNEFHKGIDPLHWQTAPNDRTDVPDRTNMSIRPTGLAFCSLKLTILTIQKPKRDF